MSEGESLWLKRHISVGVCKGGLSHSEELEQVPQRGCAVSAQGGFQDQSESSPEQLGLA